MQIATSISLRRGKGKNISLTFALIGLTEATTLKIGFGLPPCRVEPPWDTGDFDRELWQYRVTYTQEWPLHTEDSDQSNCWAGTIREQPGEETTPNDPKRS